MVVPLALDATGTPIDFVLSEVARCRGGHTPVLHGADGSVGNSVRASPRWSGWPPETARGRGDASRTGRGVNAARPIPPLRAVEQQGVGGEFVGIRHRSIFGVP